MNKNNWPKVCLGDICEFYYGKALKADKRINGIIPVFSSAGITGYQ
jgi:type I restriction enzyme S subunit